MSVEEDFGLLAEELSPEDLRAVLAVFALDVKRLTAELASAAGAGDAEAFRRVAHGLAGASGAVGATQLEHACRSAMVRGDLTPGELPALAGAIDGLADASLSRLATFLDELDAAERAHG